jgi:hypothetical protein
MKITVTLTEEVKQPGREWAMPHRINPDEIAGRKNS